MSTVDDVVVDRPRKERKCRLRAPSEVYFAKCGPYVKIGCSCRSHQRVHSFRTSNPFEVILLGYIIGGEDKERSIHNMFKHLRHRDEWLHYTAELEDWIRRICYFGGGGRFDAEGHKTSATWNPNKKKKNIWAHKRKLYPKNPNYKKMFSRRES